MSKTSRRKFTSQFKTKVCLEAIKEQQTIEALSKNMIYIPPKLIIGKRNL